MRRKKRDSDKSQVNFMKPIVDILTFGSENDPCFGKHYSTQASECNKCGDNELCAIAMAQKANMTRKKLSEKESFKDEEDTELDVLLALKNIVITNQVKRTLEVYKLVKKKFGLQSMKEAKELTLKAVKKSKVFKLIKKKDGKRYINYSKA